jgi:N-acetyltransferase
MDWIKPIVLTGRYATLLPLALEHHDDLVEATKDGELWKLWYATVPSPENMLKEINYRLAEQQFGRMIPFAVIDNKSGKAVGMTTCFKISEADRRLDIGWTWYRKSVQKTAINTECKLLMLKHAFEELKCIAVGLGANYFNKNSQRAIERLGAKYEGTIRNLRIMPNGAICDFCMYSIINSEWNTVQTNLIEKLNEKYLLS